MWIPGDRIVLRARLMGRLAWVGPMIVVEDSPEYIALYLPVGTPIKIPVHLDGTRIPRAIPYEERFALQWRLGDGVWHSTARLMMTRPSDHHAFSAFWDGTDWSFLGWYVDLLAPLERTPIGFDTEDHVLDLLVAPDYSWKWKDEDEFAAAQQVGRFDKAQADAIRAEAERVIERIEARAWPLNAGWESWRPDTEWATPLLPPCWDIE